MSGYKHIWRPLGEGLLQEEGEETTTEKHKGGVEWDENHPWDHEIRWLHIHAVIPSGAALFCPCPRCRDTLGPTTSRITCYQVGKELNRLSCQPRPWGHQPKGAKVVCLSAAFSSYVFNLNLNPYRVPVLTKAPHNTTVQLSCTREARASLTFWGGSAHSASSVLRSRCSSILWWPSLFSVL